MTNIVDDACDVLAVLLIFLAMTIEDLSHFGNGISELSITKNRIPKLLLVRFLLPLLFRQMVEQLHVFGGHITISQPMLKIMS